MKLYLLSFFLFNVIFSFGQADERFVPADLKERIVKLSINNELPVVCKLPFSSVRVIDCRPDTSKIGFMRRNANGGKNGFRKLVFKNSLRQELENNLNEHYKDCMVSNNMQLLILVKRFWADPLPNRQVQQQGNLIRASVFDMYLKLELLLEKDGFYFPLKRIDTLFQTTVGKALPDCDGWETKDCEMYGYAVSKVFEAINFDYYANRLDKAKTKISKYQLDSFINSYHNYPILKEKYLKAGVYMSFSEFRNNNPSVINYKIEEDKKAGRMLFDTTNGNKGRIHKYWGYCDGKNIYCLYMQYPLARAGNTFEFFTDRVEYEYNYSTASGSYGTLHIPYTYKKKSLEPFQIDMETGKIY